MTSLSPIAKKPSATLFKVHSDTDRRSDWYELHDHIGKTVIRFDNRQEAETAFRKAA